MNNVIVVKIGGATLGSHDTALEDIVQLQRQGKELIVVHGGGKLITEWLEKQGIATRFVQGERVTDQPTLEIVISVLAGLVNKDIVASINGLGGRAAGISGVDGSLIEGRIRDPEKGYVGEVVKVNGAILESLLESGFIPVVAPIGLNAPARPAVTPPILNFNADTIAGEIAAAVAAERLIFLTDVDGVRGQSGKLLTELSPGEAEALVASGVASGGMIPKVKACLRALANTPATCIIDGRHPHALLRQIEGEGSGTTIQK
ncbi:MAG: acetylglutamate kinase [Dehalococcoidales bacterium]|nr:acetylglutamate kinase [Dehalococcoidales bacterium]